MYLSEDQIIEKYGKVCGHCNRNTLLPNQYESTCFSCGYNVIRRNHELSKIQRKRINFIIRLKYAELKINCVCVDVYKSHENIIHYDKVYKVLPTLKKSKINNISNEKYKDMLENPDFEQFYFSRTTIGIYNIEHYSFRLMKWLAYYDRSYHENINSFYMLGSVLTCLIEVS